jgi:hypothetical protein
MIEIELAGGVLLRVALGADVEYVAGLVARLETPTAASPKRQSQPRESVRVVGGKCLKKWVDLDAFVSDIHLSGPWQILAMIDPLGRASAGRGGTAVGSNPARPLQGGAGRQVFRAVSRGSSPPFRTPYRFVTAPLPRSTTWSCHAALPRRVTDPHRSITHGRRPAR